MGIRDANVTIMVKDINQSVAFYQSIGFTLKKRWADYYAQLSVPGLVIGLHPSEANDPIASGNISIGFTTDNFEGSRALLSKLLIRVQERAEEGGQFLHFTDPDGVSLYFINPKQEM